MAIYVFVAGYTAQPAPDRQAAGSRWGRSNTTNTNQDLLAELMRHALQPSSPASSFRADFAGAPSITVESFRVSCSSTPPRPNCDHCEPVDLRSLTGTTRARRRMVTSTNILRSSSWTDPAAPSLLAMCKMATSCVGSPTNRVCFGGWIHGRKVARASRAGSTFSDNSISSLAAVPRVRMPLCRNAESKFSSTLLSSRN